MSLLISSIPGTLYFFFLKNFLSAFLFFFFNFFYLFDCYLYCVVCDMCSGGIKRRGGGHGT